MSILSGFEKVKRYIKTTDGYKKLSQWTSSQTVELADGSTLQEKVQNWDDAYSSIHSHENKDVLDGTTATYTSEQDTAISTLKNSLINGSGQVVLDATKLYGTIDIARIPQGALDRLVIVSNDAARYALTKSNVQNGDTVKVQDTGVMYYVVDEDNLDSSTGYEPYTASASSVNWSNIVGKPTEYPPSAHTHTTSDITNIEDNFLKLSGGTMTGNVNIGTNSIYVNNGTAYGIKYGSKTNIVAATTSTTATRTGLVIGQVGSESSSYGAMIFGASSYIYTKGSLVLNTTGSVAANDNRAITGNKINEYFNSIGSSYFKNIIDTSNTSVNVLDGTRTNLQSYTFPSGTYIISCYAEFGTQAAYNNQGIRQIVLSSSSGGEAIDLTCIDQQMPNPVYYAGKVYLSFTTILRFTANAKRYLVAWQKSGETLPVVGRIKALRLGD